MTDRTTSEPVYDRIGVNYTRGRNADPRWQSAIAAALASSDTILNVGAGTGSYEPNDRTVTAVEPSPTMIAQRPPGGAPVVQATAEQLPFEDNQFDATMAILTVHHWTDLAKGISEIRRVSNRQVILTFDPDRHAQFWLCDYIPEIGEFEIRRTPAIGQVADLLATDDIRTLTVPHDMHDGVLIANWRRPHAYLDPAVRACCSGLMQIDQNAVHAGVRRLRSDLLDGTWQRRYGELQAESHYDGGYRLIVGAEYSPTKRT